MKLGGVIPEQLIWWYDLLHVAVETLTRGGKKSQEKNTWNVSGLVD